MKDKVYEHVVNFFKNNEFEFEIQEIKLDKIKQPNSKPAYTVLISTTEVDLRLVIAQNNENILVINKNISSYELNKIAFNDLVEENRERQQKHKKRLQIFKEKEAKKNHNKEFEALEIRQARKNKMS